MKSATERLMEAAEASEARSLSMLARLREVASGVLDLDELLDIDKPRLASAAEGEGDTDPEGEP